MSFDILSYVMGVEAGGKENVVIESGITCTGDGEGNITITEEENNG